MANQADLDAMPVILEGFVGGDFMSTRNNHR